jgi:hypothetical protein
MVSGMLVEHTFRIRGHGLWVLPYTDGPIRSVNAHLARPDGTTETVRGKVVQERSRRGVAHALVLPIDTDCPPGTEIEFAA